jgi:hypothetical protein
LARNGKNGNGNGKKLAALDPLPAALLRRAFAGEG